MCVCPSIGQESMEAAKKYVFRLSKKSKKTLNHANIDSDFNVKRASLSSPS